MLIFVGLSKPLLRYGDFSPFINDRCLSSWIFKIRNCNWRPGWEGEYASLCQFSWQSVKSLPKYGDFWYFKMAAVRHLGLVMRVIGSHAQSSWWSSSLSKIWLEPVVYVRCVSRNVPHLTCYNLDITRSDYDNFWQMCFALFYHLISVMLLRYLAK